MSNILDKTYDFLGRFIAYPNEETRVGHTLWIAHVHLMDEWRTTARIAFLSPERESGKTRALEITALLVPRPVLAWNASPAYLFRKVSDKAGPPTILYDELDAVFGPKAKGDNEELRGFFNAGYKKGATAGRCVTRGNNIETEDFPAYCALALSGIGNLPDTVLSRSVIVPMKRRKPSEHVEQYRAKLVEPEGKAIRERLEAWADTQRGAIGQAEPVMPNGVEDRAAEIWEPLLAVADAVGGDWPERARVSAVTLVTQYRGEGEGSLGVRLLSDLRTLFNSESVDKLHTTTVLERLSQLSEAPWGNIRGEPISDRLLANLLKQYQVKSKAVRIGEVVKKGYERADLLDAWDRYLSPLPSPQEALQGLQALQSSSSIEFDFSVPSLPISATEATAANDNRKPSFDEFRDMSRAEQDALHARLRKRSNF